MKKKLIVCLSFIFALCLCASIPLFSQTAYAYTNSEIPETDDFPIVGYTSGVSAYSHKAELAYYTEEEATEEGVPEGYTGGVLKIINTDAYAGCGVTMDYSEENIPVRLIDSMTFRVYCYATINEVRITNSNGSSWQLRHAVSSAEKNVWIDLTLNATTVATLANKSGNLGILELGFRLTSGADFIAYLDEITFDFVPDENAPTINFDDDSVTVTAGKPIDAAITATAYDAEEQRNVKVQYILEDEDAVDEDGNLLPGTYTVILKATDLKGNIAEKSITVTVKERDAVPPVISFPGGNLTDVNAVVGTYPLIYGIATDNEDEVQIEYSWSEGALDEDGRLTAGTHTLTLTSADSTGNEATATVTIHVYETEDEFLVLK